MNNDSYDNHINHINTIPTSTSLNTDIVSNDDTTMIQKETDATITNLLNPQQSPQPALDPIREASYKTIPPFILELSEYGFILKYKWSPWPQNIHKMLVINQKYVEKGFKWDETPGMETHTHEYSTSEALEDRRKEILKSHNLYNLRHVPWGRGNIYAWENRGIDTIDILYTCT